MRWYQCLLLHAANIVAYFCFGYYTDHWQTGEDYAWGAFCELNLCYSLFSIDFKKQNKEEKTCSIEEI